VTNIPERPEPIITSGTSERSSLAELIRDVSNALVKNNPFIDASKPTAKERIMDIYWRIFYTPFFVIFYATFAPIAAILSALIDVVSYFMVEEE
jgi:hypothetical protein